MSLKSMTGFARVRDTIFDVEVVISIKSVNHRGLDPHFYISSDLDPFEAAMRAAIKRHIGRGHIDLRVQLTRCNTIGFSFDNARLEAYVTAYRAAATLHGIVAEPDLNAALRLPGMLNEGGTTDIPASFEVPLVALLERGLETLNEFRSREGEDLAQFMRERAAAIRDATDRMAEIRSTALPAFQTRLRERIFELLGSVNLDPQRLVQEVAMLADRSDVGEEISRLKIHSSQVDAILESGTEAGKKLDFLLQE
ncbi:MAG: DUF1732 domain-containing protein, partial [Bryobacteraceae bacterium]